MTTVHPFVVHFPLALLAAAFLLEIAALLFRNAELSRAGWWNQLLGTLGIAGAVLTGLAAGNAARLEGNAREIFELHEQIAFVVSATFALLLLWRIGTKTELPNKSRAAYMALFAFGIGLMVYGAWFGGELVYRYGTGVRTP
jgi:uncharacterized membrane protein